MHRIALLLLLSLTALPALAEETIAVRVLAEMNLARTQPRIYARIVAAELPRTSAGRSAALELVRHLEKMRPAPALSASPGLSAAALAHVAEAGPRGSRGHRGSGFSSPWSRIDRFGQRHGTAAENICYGPGDPRAIVLLLLVDAGVWSRGHRKNILNPDLTMAGIACGPHAGYGTMCVIDFAAYFVERGSPGRAIAAR